MNKKQRKLPRKKKTNSSHKKKSGKERAGKMIFRFFLLLLFLCVVIFAAYFVYREIRFSHLRERTGVADIVFKQIEFDRFVSVANRVTPESGAMLTRWSLYYVKGTADIQFDIRNLEFRRDGMDIIVRYHSVREDSYIEPSRLPFIIDVDIRDEDFREVKTFSPQLMREEQIDSIATVAGGLGVAAGTAGGAFAGWVGSAPAGLIPVLSLPVRGGITTLGALLGGAGGGVAGYALMKNFLIELKLAEEVGQTSREEIFSSARSLVASELFFDERLSGELIADWKRYMIALLADYGYSQEHIFFADYEKRPGEPGL